MNSDKLQIRGNPDEFLHTGTIAYIFMWVFIAVFLYYSNPKSDAQISFIIMFVVIWLFVLLGILIQTISIDGEYIIYSSNFFPLLKRKIRIADIFFIGFGKNFMPIADPTGISKWKMGITDEPIVGLRIYDRNGSILGGFNTKVYYSGDIKLVIQKIIELNPSVKSDWV
jgi:hypothetical protein